MSNPTVAFVTQVVVSEDDPAFKNPTKFIGPFFTEEESRNLRKREGWVMKEDSGRGYRRVVPAQADRYSGKKEISEMADKGYVVIACGGGIPV
jgi:carbamate kinase